MYNIWSYAILTQKFAGGLYEVIRPYNGLRVNFSAEITAYI